MSELQQMERILWFDQQIRAEQFPNARAMAEQFEVSSKTAQRTINFIRDRLHGPIEYDPQRRGFHYREADFVLSVARFNEEDILVLLLARKLLSSSIGGAVGMAVKGLGRSLAKALDSRCLTFQRIEEGFSALWHGHRPAQAQTFRHVSTALLETLRICFSYHTAAMKNSVERTVQPHHLQHYMGSWLLIAWCELREEWRKFYLCRIDALRILDTTFVPRPRQEWGHHVEGAFGVFQGKETQEVRLLFSPFMARYIREQVWHPDQFIPLRSRVVVGVGGEGSPPREVEHLSLIHVIRPEEIRAEHDPRLIEVEPLDNEHAAQASDSIARVPGVEWARIVAPASIWKLRSKRTYRSIIRF